MVYLLHTKDEIAWKLQECVNYVRNKFDRTPKALRSDKGTEYSGQYTKSVLKKDSIEYQATSQSRAKWFGREEKSNAL